MNSLELQPDARGVLVRPVGRDLPALHGAGDPLQPFDPLRGRGVGAEDPPGQALVLRLGYPHPLAGGVVTEIVRSGGHSGLQLPQGSGQCTGLAGDPRAGLVGEELPVAGDRHLHQQGRNRHRDHHDDADDEEQSVVAVPAPPAGEAHEEHHPRSEGQNGRDGRGDSHDEDVTVLHMRHLVTDNALELVVVQDAKDAGRRHDGGVVGVPPGGEGVGHLGVADADLRHGKTGLVSDLPHDVVQARLLGLRHDAHAVGAQGALLREPVRVEADDDGENRHHRQAHQAVSEDPAYEIAYGDEDERQHHEYQRRAENPLGSHIHSQCLISASAQKPIGAGGLC